MEKVDINATREAVIKSIMDMTIPDDAPDDEKDQLALIKRGANCYAELIAFAAVEADRNTDDPMKAIVNVAYVIGSALSSITGSVEDVDNPENMTGAHHAIHVLLDVLDKELHTIYYAKKDGSIDDISYAGTTVEVVRRNVGDA